MRPWVFCTVLWGAGFHEDVFFRAVLPSLLAEGNLPDFGEIGEFLFYGDEHAIARAQQDPGWQRLCVKMPVTVVPIGAVPTAERYKHWTVAQQDALERAKGSWLVTLLPDTVHPRGTLVSMLDVEEDARVICMAGVSAHEGMLQELGYYSNGVRPSTMIDMALRNLHASMLPRIVPGDDPHDVRHAEFTTWPSLMLWPARDTAGNLVGFAIKNFHAMPLAVRSEGRQPMDTMDKGLLSAMRIEPREVRMLTHPGQGVLVEITHSTDKAARRVQPFSFDDIAAWALDRRRCDPIEHALFLDHTVQFGGPWRGGDAMAEAVARAEEFGARMRVKLAS